MIELIRQCSGYVFKAFTRPTRAPRLVSASMLVAGVLLMVGCRPPEAPAERAAVRDFENLVVIMIDTLRSDHLPAYGYERPTAPYLSQLAEEGIQLQGYSASSWTRSSVATMLTGLYPQRHRAISRNDKLPAAVPYLPEILASYGFNNLALVANGNVSAQFGFDRGYASFEERVKFGKPEASQLVNEVLARAGELQAPYYLYLHLIDPHDPYVPKTPWQRPDAKRTDYVQPNAILRGERPLDAESVSWMIDQYDAEILEMDGAIRNLIEGLTEAGVLDSTLVVVTSDHGEEFGEHGGVGHGKSLYEEVIRVPYVLWAADSLAAYRSPSAFHQVDFLPTALQALGIAAPKGLDGTSQWAALQDPAYPGGGERLFHLELDKFRALALLSSPYKVYHRLEEPQNLAFDLARDPDELDTGQASFDDDREAKLRQRMVRLDRDLKSRRYERETAEATGDVRKQLAALGYLGDDGDSVPGTGHEDLYGNPLDKTLAADLIVDLVLDLRRPSRQLLQGWIFPDGNGTWSAPRSRLVVPVSPDAREIVLAGHSVAARPAVRCSVAINGDLVKEVDLSPGGFELTVAIPDEARAAGVAYVDLTVRPPLQMPGIPQPVGLHWNRVAVR